MPTEQDIIDAYERGVLEGKIRAYREIREMLNAPLTNEDQKAIDKMADANREHDKEIAECPDCQKGETI